MGTLLKFFAVFVIVFVISSIKHVKCNEIGSSIYQNEEFRLSTSVWPENYKMQFMVILDEEPGYERFTAPAKAWVKINSSEPTSVITMHAINLTINSNTVQVKRVLTDESVLVLGVSYTEEYNFVHIELGQSMNTFEIYEIFIEFVTPISGDRLNGMYQDFYQDANTGDTRYIATTLHAPYHSRRTFPSFDEPRFRATYDITLGHHDKYHAMSNADILETNPIENMPGWYWDTFQTSPSMSSYIQAMIVSDLAFEEAPSNTFRNVTIRVYAKPQSIEQGAGIYSAKLTGDVMSFLESLFVVPYPISKLYSVALPQFFFNAMENYGLITYKEPVLLYLPNQTTEEERYKINYVLSHELSHQYFGNLVACKWWGWVWLKEGFATYYSHHGMQHTNPELVPWVQFIPKILYVAMAFDATNGTHPLENFPPTSPAVADIYTRIPYEKGASILRMASSMFTDSVFYSGIKEYVNTFQYDIAEQDDVFNQLQMAVDASELVSPLIPTTVKAIMDTWTKQSGFPVLTVSAPNSNTLRVTQKKFIGDDPSNPSDTWWVPIYLSPRPNNSLPENFPDDWIPQNVDSVTISINTNQVVLVNPWAFGYYRVLYETKMMNRIVKQLERDHEKIPAITRSKIINDYSNFIFTEYSDIEAFLKLTSYMSREQDLVVWEGLFPFLDKVSKMLGEIKIGTNFKSHFGQMASDALNLLEQKTHPKSLEVGTKAILQSKLARISCDFEIDTCINKSLSQFNSWKEGIIPRIPLSTQEAVFCTAISLDTDNKNWDYTYNAVTEESKPLVFSPLKTRLLKSLGCSTDPENIQLLIKQIKMLQYFSNSEALDLLIQMAGKPIGNKELWKVIDKTPQFLNPFVDSNDFRSFVDALCSFPMNNEKINTLKKVQKNFPTNFLENYVKNRAIEVSDSTTTFQQVVKALIQNLE